ncbi:hypothetical protein MTR_7g087080 [Medicago truncatula]|uniref:Uncharacterized protein n=1 Tax=Medicago truncatula TaxID=3880 RepID=G7L2L2_MEDTR|nr:hypothetical protein MTR_7g087080 [Medicago truncatula]
MILSLPVAYSGEESVVDRVELLDWKWFRAKCPASSYSLYEWKVQPVLCWDQKGFVVVDLPGVRLRGWVGLYLLPSWVVEGAPSI